MSVDWREDSSCMNTLVKKLYNRPETNNAFSDVTFQLPDGSLVQSHKLILSLASPYFEAKFFGLLSSEESPVVVRNVESSAFRRVLEYIYKSGEVEWIIDNMEYWNLLQVAHMYLIPGLISLCNCKLSSFLNTITDNRELVEHVNKASQLYVYEGILSSGLAEIKSRLPAIINTETWNLLGENVVIEILDDERLKVSEGSLFSGMVSWCLANTIDRAAAITKFQNKFAPRVKVKNMTKDTFLKTIGESDFISPDLFKTWTFEFMKNNTVNSDATRNAHHPLKVHQTIIEQQDFLEPRAPHQPLQGEVAAVAGPAVGLPGAAGQPPAPARQPGPGPNNPQDHAGHDTELWRIRDEYEDVNILIRIFQKVTESGGTRSKFGILLETMHKARQTLNRGSIKERVSVKMVAKKQDGTVVKKLFKPIEDSNKEGPSHRCNIFVLSKNKEERATWHVMEVVVIIDRRPTCHIKGIAGHEFATTVCQGKAQAYLNKAASFHFAVNLTIKQAVEELAAKLGVEGQRTQMSQWLYIFTKGYVSNLRSRRAMPNDYWTAESVEDYMRCKVINFPIGVQNEAMRRNAFRTWIISQKVTDDKDKDKNVFVCTYNPDSQDVKFLKTFSLPVKNEVETLGLLEHISLGSVKVDEKFFHDVTLGVPLTPGVKIFIRRIFPIQDENDENTQRVLVTEAILGSTLTHIDDCHVLVVQTSKRNEDALDFDEYLRVKIREVSVTFVNKDDPDHIFELRMDPVLKKPEILQRVCDHLEKPRNMVEIYKYWSGRSFPYQSTQPNIRDCEGFDSMFQYCDETDRKIFYRNLTDQGPEGGPTVLDESSKDVLDDMETV